MKQDITQKGGDCGQPPLTHDSKILWEYHECLKDEGAYRRYAADGQSQAQWEKEARNRKNNKNKGWRYPKITYEQDDKPKRTVKDTKDPDQYERDELVPKDGWITFGAREKLEYVCKDGTKITFVKNKNEDKLIGSIKGSNEKIIWSPDTIEKEYEIYTLNGTKKTDGNDKFTFDPTSNKDEEIQFFNKALTMVNKKKLEVFGGKPKKSKTKKSKSKKSKKAKKSKKGTRKSKK